MDPYAAGVSGRRARRCAVGVCAWLFEGQNRRARGNQHDHDELDRFPPDGMAAFRSDDPPWLGRHANQPGNPENSGDPAIFPVTNPLPPGIFHRAGGGLSDLVAAIQNNLGFEPAYSWHQPACSTLCRAEYNEIDYPGYVPFRSTGWYGRRRAGFGSQPQYGTRSFIRLRF